MDWPLFLLHDAALMLGLTVVLFVWSGLMLTVPGFDAREHEWVPESVCVRLLWLFSEEPGLQHFRDEVLSQGRTFTRREHRQVQQWCERQYQLRDRTSPGVAQVAIG